MNISLRDLPQTRPDIAAASTAASTGTDAKGMVTGVARRTMARTVLTTPSKIPRHGLWNEISSTSVSAHTKDALCLSREHRARNVRQPSTNGSALRCISLLGTLVLIAHIASCVLPEARIQHLFQPVPHGIKLIHNSDYSNDHTATISARQYTMWKARRQRLFDEFSYYQVRPETLVRDEIEPQELSVAYSSLNLFSMLGLVHRIPSHEAQPNDPEVILSDGIWTRQFARDPQIVGSLVQIGSNKAVVAGVIPDQLWMLPGKVDAWLFGARPGSPSTPTWWLCTRADHRASRRVRGAMAALGAIDGWSAGVLRARVPVVRRAYDPCSPSSGLVPYFLALSQAGRRNISAAR